MSQQRNQQNACVKGGQKLKENYTSRCLFFRINDKWLSKTLLILFDCFSSTSSSRMQHLGGFYYRI
ncbi:predicted protein [Botrytis cinerea T4]|uniref:Uncharacterized protein n=1 Tax=Botryotinia fuckeliana (strain T4) TaxID=999810 RepID=G2Y0Z9_BOTF4|nr:predicted protein [Botrytis cinerea T4]